MVRRGEVYVADLSKFGGRLGKSRPVVVVQNDVGNRYSPETIVAAVRDAHGGAQLPVFVPVEAGVGGLVKRSVVDAGHVVTVPQESLGACLGRLPASVMFEVDRALLVSLGLPR